MNGVLPMAWNSAAPAVSVRRQAGEQCTAVYPVRLAAFEQVGQLVLRRAGALFLRTVIQQFDERAGRRAAEGVTDEIDLLDLAFSIQLAPVRDERLVIGVAVTFVAELLRMDFSVVHCAADDLCVQFTGAVPHGVERADTRLVHFEAGFAGRLYDVAVRTEAEVGEDLREQRLLAVAEEPVHHNERIVAGLFEKISLANDLLIHSTIISLEYELEPPPSSPSI